jgi:hypothetical protein
MAISKDAKLMLNFLNRTTLTLGNEENRLSERASRAITELMGEKLVLAQKADDLRAASMSYSLTEKGQKSKLLDPRFIFEDDGKFPLTTPNT